MSAKRLRLLQPATRLRRLADGPACCPVPHCCLPLCLRIAGKLKKDSTERGWEVFSLQYHVDGPLGAVLSPDAMAGKPSEWCLPQLGAATGSWHKGHPAICMCRPARMLPPLPRLLPRLAGYLRIFRLLWTIKHVEAVLGKCWDAINAAQRALAAMRAQERLHGVAVDNVELVGGWLEAGRAW